MRVIIVLFDEVQGIDVFGPAEVLAGAARLLAGGGYRLIFASVRGGPCRTSCGASVSTRRLRTVRVGPGDTVLVAGGYDGPVAAAAADRQLLAWLRRAASVARRVGSVCPGAFILGALGLL